jgi:GNAT superfamily N-acetyltransferase
MAIMLRDTASGQNLGGLWGQLYYDWLFVELLFVPDHLRGEDFGSHLLAKAEELARQKSCAGIWLDTHSFQAPAFYVKQGYETFGMLDDYPKGEKRFFFRKLLDDVTVA